VPGLYLGPSCPHSLFTLRPLLHGPLNVPGPRVGNGGPAIPGWTAAAILLKDLEKQVESQSFLIMWSLRAALLLLWYRTLVPASWHRRETVNCTVDLMRLLLVES